MSVHEVDRVLRAVTNALEPHGQVVLAVSGGLDSMVLLDAAAQVVPRARLGVATYDHGTGPSATTAAEAVARRCVELGVDCVVGRAETSLRSEAELREARWRFLRRVASERRAVVATAHTEDDQVETVLMRVMREAGPRGLAGLYARGPVVRPLIALRRECLSAYTRAVGVQWVEDPSNRSPRYLRNRLRHDLLPALRRAHPIIDAELLAIARKAAVWRADVEDFVAEAFEGQVAARRDGLDVSAALLAERSREELSILWPALAARVGAMLDRRGIARVAAFGAGARTGSKIELAGGWRVIRSRDAFQLRASAQRAPLDARALDGEVQWGEWTFRPTDEPGGNDAMSAHLPVGAALSVRPWRPGDTMVAHSGRPPRKVKQLLSRAGITGHERVDWPVVLSGDRIIWVPGVRRGDAATERSGRPGLTFVCEHNRR